MKKLMVLGLFVSILLASSSFAFKFEGDILNKGNKMVGYEIEITFASVSSPGRPIMMVASQGYYKSIELPAGKYLVMGNNNGAKVSQIANCQTAQPGEIKKVDIIFAPAPAPEITFKFPTSIDINGNDDIFVFDNGGVRKLSKKNGQLLFDKMIGVSARAFTIDGENNILFFDQINSEIKKYNKDGGFIETFMTTAQLPPINQVTQVHFKMAFNKSSGDFCFSNEKGDVFVYNKDKKLMNTLSFISPMQGLLFDNNGSLYITFASKSIFKSASPLSGYAAEWVNTGFSNQGLGIDKNGFIYCATSDRILKFDQQGAQIAVLGEGQFSDAKDVAIDSGGTIYVVGKKDGQYKLIILKP